MIWKLRTALFWTHLAVGVVIGLFILNMAVSGISIAYDLDRPVDGLSAIF